MTEADGRDRRRDQSFPEPHTVLVTDDSAAIRMIVRKTLQEAGIRVNEAANGSEALAYCVVDRPDVILLDIDMPVMDGVTALRKLKADPELSGIPVLMLTAHTEGDEVAQAFEMGAQDYVRKPCAPVELLARVKGVLKIQGQQEFLYRRAEELGVESETDPLTGLGNRRYLARVISDFQVEQGAQTPIGIAILDIDRFKRINDDLGHAVGDLVLTELAQRLREFESAQRVIVRWGGEEFVVGVTNPTDDDLATIGEAVRSSVASKSFGIGAGSGLDVTVSVGCAEGSLDLLRETIEAADSALYRAKELGRNRVEFDVSCTLPKRP